MVSLEKKKTGKGKERKEEEKMSNLHNVGMTGGAEGLNLPLVVLLNVGITSVEELLDGHLGPIVGPLKHLAKVALPDHLSEPQVLKSDVTLAGRLPACHSRRGTGRGGEGLAAGNRGS